MDTCGYFSMPRKYGDAYLVYTTQACSEYVCLCVAGGIPSVRGSGGADLRLPHRLPVLQPATRRQVLVGYRTIISMNSNH